MRKEIEIRDASELKPHTCTSRTGGSRCDICFGPLDKQERERMVGASSEVPHDPEPQA